MASITIRRLDDEVKTRLRVRAAANGRSMARRHGSSYATQLAGESHLVQVCATADSISLQHSARRAILSVAPAVLRGGSKPYIENGVDCYPHQ